MAANCELLTRTGESFQTAAREMIVFELYRRGSISSGKAAELLGLSRIDFIKRASELGVAYFRLTEEEIRTEGADR